MNITEKSLSEIAGKPVNSNMISAAKGLEFGGETVGLHRPHRFAMFVGQVGHESMGWHYDREIWGPTAAQKSYEGREELGNTEPGDGSLFRGYTPIQITGRHNTTEFYKWCVLNFPNLEVPNFIREPHLMNTDPWEGLGPLWYWSKGKPQSLNVPADKGDFLSVTRLVNGGTNGLTDRYRYYGEAALHLLGMEDENVRAFQRKFRLTADNVMGKNTLAKMHSELMKLPDLTFGKNSVTVIDKIDSVSELIVDNKDTASNILDDLQVIIDKYRK